MENLGAAGLELSVSSCLSNVETVKQKGTFLEIGDEGKADIKQESVKITSKEEDLTECLREKLGKLKIERDTEEDIHSTTTSTPPEPQTPACKGYIIESDFANLLLGACRYFTAPIKRHHDFSEFAVFSLSLSRRIVSLVDDQSAHRSHPILDSHYDIVEFEIGGLSYQWNTQNNTLAYENRRVESGASEHEQSPVALLNDLDQARALAKKFQEESRHFSIATPGRSGALELSDSNAHWRDTTVEPPIPSSHSGSPNGNDTNGYVGSETSSFIEGASPSPPMTMQQPTTPAETPNLYFGRNAKQQDIDNWVEICRATHNGRSLKCPEDGCNASSRRPHALKTHLYTHYGIKPFKCEVCFLPVLTESNLSRHKKNCHNCPGCHTVQLDVKAHKAVCPRAADIMTLRKRGRKDRNLNRSTPS